ncbi:MAG: hypothetical protein QM774_04490 [Gordonia sp. (in: high G+C Gram-positive bacteria)]|uniref:hypothetical protein n=1 Tax=Gordonia sp. (in: high G+C Gram-positive bacteria) TaxID=84139 RepID=UPI0039E6655B
MLGPIELPSAEVARSRLHDFAALGPAARLGLEPRSDRSHWTHRADRVVDAVTVQDEPRSPLDLLNGPPAGAPFRLTLAGRYLRTEHDHGLGEVALAVMTHLVVTGAVDPADPDLRRAISRRGQGLPGAVWRTFGRDPRRMREVLRQARDPEPVADEPGPYPADPVTGPAAAHLARIDADGVADIRRWRERSGTGASLLCARPASTSTTRSPPRSTCAATAARAHVP